MKNPFQKESHNKTYIVIAAGALTAGAVAYLYLTEGGAETRNSIFHKIKDEAKNLASIFISEKTGVHKDTVKKVADKIVK